MSAEVVVLLLKAVAVVVTALVASTALPAAVSNDALATTGSANTTTTTPATQGDPSPRACNGPGLVASWPLSRRLAQLEMVEVTFGGVGLPSYAGSGAGGVVYMGQPDEEGGGVARLSNVIGALPWERQQAATWTPAQLEAQLATDGAAMRAIGFTMDLAPVIDTAPAGDTSGQEGLRSYSVNGPTAAAYGIAAVRGLEQGGVVPGLKHFPGLGHANADTDLTPATDPPLGQLLGNDLVPFADGIHGGAPVVMMSHAVVPGLTNGRPTSLSPPAYRYLRRNLRFTGLTITDSLGAGAISGSGYSEATAAVAAVAAGADMVLVNGAAFGSTLTALIQAVDDGALTIAQVNGAVDQVLQAKGVRPRVRCTPTLGGVSTIVHRPEVRARKSRS